jgi:hypothetical protein
MFDRRVDDIRERATKKLCQVLCLSEPLSFALLASYTLSRNLLILAEGWDSAQGGVAPHVRFQDRKKFETWRLLHQRVTPSDEEGSARGVAAIKKFCCVTRAELSILLQTLLVRAAEIYHDDEAPIY